LSSGPSSGHGSGSALVISGISLPTALQDMKQKGAKIVNLHPNPALQALIPANVKLRSFMGDAPPPLLDDGSQPCLSYIRQSCWTTCKRAASHRALSPQEQNRLLPYLQSQARRAQGNTTPATVPGRAPAGTVPVPTPP